MNIERVLEKARKIVGENHVFSSLQADQMYGSNTNGIERIIGGAIRPHLIEEIQALVKLANKEKVPLYPISTGHNWGYGTAVPVTDNNIILDLSEMNSILDFDKHLGVVTVEPGVTQQKLYNFLEKHKYPYLVPVTGAGPTGSILGNALERGFGITPMSDHFTAVTTITAVLPDGTLYRSPLEEAGCSEIDRLYKYGVGAYLDGIFTQSNLGIVVSVSIALARKPEITKVVLIKINSDKQLGDVIRELPELLSTLTGITTGFKFVNKNQTIAMTGDVHDSAISKKLLPEWSVACGLFGNKEIVTSAEKILKKKLKHHVDTVITIDAKKYHALVSFLERLPFYQKVRKPINDLSLTINLFLGIPSIAALKIAYLKSGFFPKDAHHADPGKDGAGLIWFAPLIPINTAIVFKYYKGAQQILKKYEIPELITFTTINDRCIDCPMPLVFNKNDPTSVKKVKDAYNELWKFSKTLQITPYRIPADEQWRVIEEAPIAFGVIKKIKNALDKKNIIAPGRYSP